MISGKYNAAFSNKRKAPDARPDFFVANSHQDLVACTDAHGDPRQGNGLLHRRAERAAGNFAFAGWRQYRLVRTQHAAVLQQ
jgi:hypothetical protein